MKGLLIPTGLEYSISVFLDHLARCKGKLTDELKDRLEFVFNGSCINVFNQLFDKPFVNAPGIGGCRVGRISKPTISRPNDKSCDQFPFARAKRRRAVHDRLPHF